MRNYWLWLSKLKWSSIADPCHMYQVKIMKNPLRPHIFYVVIESWAYRTIGQVTLKTATQMFNPQDLDRRMRHLSNVMNHFWKRWRKEYLLELRNSHRNVTRHSSNRVVSIGDVVIVHDEDQPRGKWRIGKVETLVTGSDGHVRGAVVRVKTKAGRLTRLRRPVQRLYPLEVRCRNEEPETTISPRRAEPDPAVSSVRPEQHPELRRDRPKRVAAIEADRRRKTWIENLNWGT